MTRSEAGMEGAKATHRKRYEAIKELSSLIAKDDLNWIQSKWKTEHIIKMVGYLRDNRN